MMYIIGIVPIDTEILCCRLQSCKSAHCLIGIGNSLRIGVLGHTPDSLDRRILTHQLLHHIHIRSFRCHGYVDHFDSEIFRDRKMPVITGYRTEKLHNGKLAPGRTAADAVRHGTRYRIIHDVQTGISVNDNLVGRNLDQIRQKLLGFLNTVDHAIVSAVDSLSAL